MPSKVFFFSSFGQQITAFAVWWLIRVPTAILRFTRETLFNFDELLQFDTTVRLLINLEPLFGDYSLSGRIIGVLARIVRVIVALAIYLAIVLLGSIALAVWYFLPFVSIVFLIA